MAISPVSAIANALNSGNSTDARQIYEQLELNAQIAVRQEFQQLSQLLPTQYDHGLTDLSRLFQQIVLAPSTDYLGEYGAISTEVIHRIYACITSPQDRITLSCVNKRLACIYQDDYLWRSLSERDFNEMLPLEEGMSAREMHEGMTISANIEEKRWVETELTNISPINPSTSFWKDLRSNKIYIGLKDGIKVWDMESKTLETFYSCNVGCILVKTEGVFLCAQLSDTRRKCGLQHRLKVWNLTTNQKVLSLKNCRYIFMQGDYLYFLPWDSSCIQIWNLQTRKREGQVIVKRDVWDFQIFDQKIFLREKETPVISIYSLETKQQVGSIPLDPSNRQCFIDGIAVDENCLCACQRLNRNTNDDVVKWDFVQKNWETLGSAASFDKLELVKKWQGLFCYRALQGQKIAFYSFKKKSWHVIKDNVVLYGNFQIQDKQLLVCTNTGNLVQIDLKFPLQSRYSKKELKRNWQLLQASGAAQELHPDFRTLDQNAASIKVLTERLFHAVHARKQEKQQTLLAQLVDQIGTSEELTKILCPEYTGPALDKADLLSAWPTVHPYEQITLIKNTQEHFVNKQ